MFVRWKVIFKSELNYQEKKLRFLLQQDIIWIVFITVLSVKEKERLTSVQEFVQVFKQNFSSLWNKNKNRNMTTLFNVTFLFLAASGVMMPIFSNAKFLSSEVSKFSNDIIFSGEGLDFHDNRKNRIIHIFFLVVFIV